MEKLASQLDIDVSPKQIDEKIQEILEFQKQRGSSEQNYDDMISNDSYRSSVAQSIKTSTSLEKLVLIAKSGSTTSKTTKKQQTSKTTKKQQTSKTKKKD